MLRRRVLLICREPALMLALHATFPPQTYEIFATPDHSAAMRQVYELQPDVVLLAQESAPAGGWLASLEALRSVSRVPVVALLAADGGMNCGEVLAHGATTCLAAPFDGARIVTEVGRLTRFGEAERAAAEVNHLTHRQAAEPKSELPGDLAAD